MTNNPSDDAALAAEIETLAKTGPAVARRRAADAFIDQELLGVAQIVAHTALAIHRGVLPEAALDGWLWGEALAGRLTEDDVAHLSVCAAFWDDNWLEHGDALAEIVERSLYKLTEYAAVELEPAARATGATLCAWPVLIATAGAAPTGPLPQPAVHAMMARARRTGLIRADARCYVLPGLFSQGALLRHSHATRHQLLRRCLDLAPELTPTEPALPWRPGATPRRVNTLPARPAGDGWLQLAYAVGIVYGADTDLVIKNSHLGRRRRAEQLRALTAATDREHDGEAMIVVDMPCRIEVLLDIGPRLLAQMRLAATAYAATRQHAPVRGRVTLHADWWRRAATPVELCGRAGAFATFRIDNDLFDTEAHLLAAIEAGLTLGGVRELVP
jgi:hypothetical protein